MATATAENNVSDFGGNSNRVVITGGSAADPLTLKDVADAASDATWNAAEALFTWDNDSIRPVRIELQNRSGSGGSSCVRQKAQAGGRRKSNNSRAWLPNHVNIELPPPSCVG